jgi:hypothetical protein
MLIQHPGVVDEHLGCSVQFICLRSALLPFICFLSQSPLRFHVVLAMVGVYEPIELRTSFGSFLTVMFTLLCSPQRLQVGVM